MLYIYGDERQPPLVEGCRSGHLKISISSKTCAKLRSNLAHSVSAASAALISSIFHRENGKKKISQLNHFGVVRCLMKQANGKIEHFFFVSLRTSGGWGWGWGGSHLNSRQRLAAVSAFLALFRHLNCFNASFSGRHS